MRWEGPGYSELEYNSVRKRELMRVDFPRPDSPTESEKKKKLQVYPTDLVDGYQLPLVGNVEQR